MDKTFLDKQSMLFGKAIKDIKEKTCSKASNNSSSILKEIPNAVSSPQLTKKKSAVIGQTLGNSMIPALKDTCCGHCSMKPIIGVIYKCIECADDYLLCQTCKMSGEETGHESHKFDEISDHILTGSSKVYPGCKSEVLTNRKEMAYELDYPRNIDFDPKTITMRIKIMNMSRVRFPPGTELKGCQTAVKQNRADLSGLEIGDSRDCVITIGRNCYAPHNTKFNFKFTIECDKDRSYRFPDFLLLFTLIKNKLQVECKVCSKANLRYGISSQTTSSVLCSSQGLLGMFSLK